METVTIWETTEEVGIQILNEMHSFLLFTW